MLVEHLVLEYTKNTMMNESTVDEYEDDTSRICSVHSLLSSDSALFCVRYSKYKTCYVTARRIMEDMLQHKC